MAGFYENISNTTVQEAAEADALASKNAASVSEANAATSAANAATSEANAATSATNASNVASSVSTDASAASASAASALASKNAAETAETNAETAETNAASSATSAANSASTATTKATEASTSASNAATSETNAASSATSASTSASTATTKASEASTSASNASTSETNAASSASSASASETSALASKNAASTSESNAATSATNAATSATNSASSATASSNSASSATTAQSAAEAARDAALAAFDSFDDRYLGQKASNPSTDNDGNALVAGTLYFNTTTDEMKVYDGSQWLNAYASLSGALLATSNLSDLNNAGTARTNLGLGTAATTASTDYATAAQGTKVDGIEASADVTDTANVTAAGALMDSELTSEASVKALNQGVATGDSPTFAGLTVGDGVSSEQILVDAGAGWADVRLHSDATNGGSIYFNDGADAGQIFYYHPENSMRFLTNASERMRIDSSGAVGIGTSSPSTKLTVSGSVRALRADDATQYGDFAQDSSGGYISTHRPHASLYENFRFLASNNSGSVERMRIDASGNVGIGRTPRVALDVAGEVAIPFDTNYGLRFYNQPQNNWSSIGCNETNSAANLVFKDSTGEAMRITSGNVGIGTSSPSATDWGSANPVVQISGTQPLLSLKDTDTGEFQIANSNQNLYFWDAVANTTRMLIDSSGTVTASPSGGVATLGTNGHITSKQSLDVATAGGRYIGSSNRGVLGQLRIEQTTTGADGGYIDFDTCANGSTSPTNRMRIDGSGNAIFTKSGGAYLQLKDASAVRGAINVTTSDGLIFTTGSSFTERMRINSSGHTSFTVGTNAKGTFSDAIGEVGSGNFALQATNSAGSALKPMGFRAEDIRFATGSTERMRIHASGAVTKPYQPSTCFCSTSTITLTNDSTWRKLALNKVIHQTGGSHFSTSNNRFTAPVAGRYLFGMDIQLESVSGTITWMYLVPFINGSVNYAAGVPTADFVPPHGTYNRRTGTMLLNLSANDYVDLYHIGAGNGTVNVKGYAESAFFLTLL